jgi:putative ABC transport system permease protein
MFHLIWRNLLRRPLRSTLTALSIVVAIFLICSLVTLLTTINAGAEHADNRRLAVMSATGLFVELPLSYQARIAQVPGIEKTTKFCWFGGYYRTPANFFAQFAVDPADMLDMYPECALPADQRESFLHERTSCIIGSGLARSFGWQVGQTVPIIGALHPHPDDKAWEFKVAGIYHSTVPNFDNRTLFFHWDYYEETLKSAGVPPNVGVYSLRVAPGTDVPRVIADVEALYQNGPQRVDCDTEAEFQRQFVGMVGNLPLFIGWIGTGVLLAIFLASVNTMLMAFREQSSEIGILKALGFTDATTFRLLVAQSLLLCCLGGAIGIALAFASEKAVSDMLGSMFPGYMILPSTYAMAAAIAVGIGLLAGLVPAWQAARLRCVEALRLSE